MVTQLGIDDVRRAWEARDPELVRLVAMLAEQPDPPPKTPIREGAYTWQKFVAEIRSRAFHKKPKEEQAHLRVEKMKALEAPEAEVPLPDRFRLHDILMKLWQDNGLFARSCLLKIIAEVHLTYGPWRALKRIFKEAEARGDTEMYGALAARFDRACAGGGTTIGQGTLAYLCRRAWRYLRRLGTTLPVCYPDAAVDFLAHYTDDTNWPWTWVANHIFYHESGQYSRGRFTYRGIPPSRLKDRAFGDLWRRTPRPLFSLLERARSEMVYDFATSALKSDFRAALREIEPSWVTRLVGVPSKTIHSFVVWILNNVPRFEQAAFRSLGLHDAVLKLFDSSSGEAQAYASEYARTHARDLPVTELVRLANNSHEAVRKLAIDLLLERDPRKDVGLEAWGALLDTQYGHEVAAKVLRKSFGARELTPEWFKDRLFSTYSGTFEFARNFTYSGTFEFARNLLPQIHPYQKLGPAFFCDLIDRLDLDEPDEETEEASWNVAEFAATELAKFDVNALEPEFLKRLLIHPMTWQTASAWVNEGRLKAQTVGVDFLKLLAYHPAWEADPWVAALKQSGRTWARQLAFNEPLAGSVTGWLGDVRRFRAADLGFDWLMQLAVRSEPRYHDFAVDTMIRAFVPADFAPKESQTTPAPDSPAAPVKVDLEGATFIFTGTLATMKRKDAEEKVRQAGGVPLSGVTGKLHYLVIGDEGSPLYDQGKKGSKQVKAEELNAAGANIKIISETAFLQMLSGEQKSHSADATRAGCERLWQMAVAPGTEDAPLAQFARKYIRRHHPDLALAQTDRPVDPGADIPQEFLTWERVGPLLFESRKPLREFALDLSRWEFARWAPPVEALVKLCESPYGEVRQFVADALLAEDEPERRRYRIDPETLSPAAVYSFCESPDETTRLFGMQLIERSARLKVPEELFRLTESPDRKVRAFVIRTLWGLYRERGTTADWKPYVPPQTTIGPAAKKAAEKAELSRGPGATHRPEELPAPPGELRVFLRRILFEIPPARMEARKGDMIEGIGVRIKPLSARRAKVALVEVMRDLALEDTEFARGVLPLFEEFMTSRGRSERDACLVAVTRIRHGYPGLNGTATQEL